MIEMTKNEELILLAIWKLGENAYGVKIREGFAEVTGKELNYGSLYNTLYLLVRRGFVSTYKSEPESKKGGKRKVHYSLTSTGRQALRDAHRLHMNAWNSVPAYAFEE